MSLTAKQTGTSFDPIPEGVFLGVCYSVVDIGTQYSEKFDKAAHKVVVTWEIPELRIDLERDGKKINLPRAISKRFTVSLGDKAILRKDLEAWRGKAFTEAELKGFDLKKLVGAACQLQIIHTHQDSKTYANVGALMALPKGVKSPKPENEALFFSFEEMGDSPIIPPNVPEWTVALIKQSREWEKLSLRQTKSATPQPAQAAPTATSPTADQPDENDLVPF